MKLRRLLCMALCLVMAMSLCVSAFAAAATSAQPKIGKNTANIVTIPMTNTVGAVLTFGNGSVNKDAEAADHIAAAGNKGTLLASVNGALFNAYYSTKTSLTFPGNCARTYGALIQNGQSVKGAGATPMLGFTGDGKALIDMVNMKVTVTFRRDTSVAMWGVNDVCDDYDTAIVMITPECGYPVALKAGAVVVHVKNNLVTAVDKGLTSVTCPAGEKLVIYNAGAWAAAEKYVNFPEVGNSAEVKTELIPERTATQADWDKVVTAVGVKPWLLQGGVDVFDRNGTMEAKMGKTYAAQRTFAAVKADGTLIIGEVSGTFADIITYLQGQGYVDAIALDGGASSMIYSGGSYLQPAGRKLTNVLHIIDYGSASAVPRKPAASDLVTPSSWAASFIDKAYAESLIPEGFDVAAKQNITRAEFCKLAYNYVEKVLGEEGFKSKLYTCGITYAEAGAAFNDISNAGFNIIVQSYRLGLVSGKGGGRFDPNGAITRQEAAALLTNTAKVVGIEAAGESMEFADSASFSSWAPTFIDFVVRAGIMTGKGTGFDPLGYFTKEQAITTFVNMLPAEE